MSDIFYVNKKGGFLDGLVREIETRKAEQERDNHLDELLSKCTPENRHPEIVFESTRDFVKVKRLHPDAVLPRKAHADDAGFDIVAVEDTIIEPGATALIKTGLAFELPPGYEMQIRPRSGVTLKTKLRVQIGTIDSNYRGEVGVIVDNACEYGTYDPLWFALNIENERHRIDERKQYGTYIIRKGDRIAQAVIQRLPDVELIEVEELGDSERGTGGFGSSGVTSE